jgi:hypothetical protein
MARKLSTIRQTVRQLLRDEFSAGVDFDWEDDELDVHIDNCLYELSGRSPYRAIEVLPTVEDSKLLDISGIEGLITVVKAEYPIGASPRNFRNFKYYDNQTIELDMDSAFSETGSSGTLTGTVTFTSGSPIVTGSGTDFDGELAEDYYIKPSGGSRWYRIASIESDISLTLEEAVKSEDAGADTVNATEYKEEVALVYCEKLHTLTEEKSTLNPREEAALVLGVCGHAAISKARSQINAVNFGGGSTPRDMENWGLTKLQLYREALRSLRPPKTKERFATS